MSGTVLSAINIGGQLFTGYGSLMLGPIKFTGFNAPTSIPFGSRQGLASKTLPGGQKIVNLMGATRPDIKWSGQLMGQGADQMARAIDRLCQTGAVVNLTFGVFDFKGFVSEFDYEFRDPPAKYRITFFVTSDNSPNSSASVVSMLLAVTQDLASGNPVAALSEVSQGIVGSSVSAAGTAAAAPGATTIGSAAYNSAVQAIGTAQTNINTAVTTANATLAPLGVTLGSLSAVAPAALDTLGFGGRITDAAQSCGDLANLTAASGFVARAGQNMMNASA